MKQLVTSEMQRMEIDPEKALESIWSAADYAIKVSIKESLDASRRQLLRK